MILDTWMSFDNREMYRVNGCMYAQVTSDEARRATRHDLNGHKRLALQRITPLIWHAMPGHEDPITYRY